ncbi:MAG TPA: putative Na+/H+ antiporter [Thermoanaerobaculia bacterium]|nr:putative Na+/H+ antiporter [Thermoanaerobaculia bacterium]
MSKPWIRGLALFLILAATLAGPALARAGGEGEATAAFPPPLSSYTGEEGMSLPQVLASRVRAEPLNLVAALLFLGAILHTFVAPKIAAYAHHLEHRPVFDADHDGVIEADERPLDVRSFRAEMLHFLGEIEAVFGIWVVPLLATIALTKGWPSAESFIHDGVVYTEPMFVVVIMAIASTRPVLQVAEASIGLLARLGGSGPRAWWLSILIVGPLLGSFITEPAAMVICALLLGRRFFELRPSARFRYATLGLLFVNISVGGTLTHFAAPPVLMVAGRWGWDLSYMASHFGWKAAIGILAATLLYALFFRRELAELAARRSEADVRHDDRPAAPLWIILIHLSFLCWTVLTAHTPALFIGGFLFFLAFLQASAPHQDELNLRPPLLVGFFLGGLVTHGALQQWWIAPVLGRLGELPLFFGAAGLTAFNDNAAITYLATLVPDFTEPLKYAVVAGAVAGGGLTVIANAPNPAGQSLLSRYFDDGISPLGLLLGALVPTAVVSAAFLLLG